MILFRFGIFLVCLAWPLRSEGRLELVQVFFRHGSRTPELKDVYPTDPYQDVSSYGGLGWGQLTNVGKHRAFRLGNLLRRHYGSFLGDQYNADILRATTTDYDRTKMTALLVMAGLFPPSKSEQWHEQLLWNPIPYDMDRAEYDYVLRRPTHFCPTYVDELKKIETSELAKNILEKQRDAAAHVSKNAGKPMNSVMDFFKIYQTLNAQDNLNMTLPEWTKSVYPEPISFLAGQQCYLENYNILLKRLNGGRSLQVAIRNIINKIKNTYPGRKIYLYSGHENNVINVLSALNLFEPHVSKYCAAVLVELHFLEEQRSYAVKVLYAKDVDDEPETKVLDNCEELCPLNKFLEITEPYVPVNYTAECKSSRNLY